MTEESPDRELSEDELALVSKLTEKQLKEIDEVILSYGHKYNRKVARIVGSTMSSLPNRINGIPDVFYSQRVAILVEKGLLIADGNLKYMRYSEVRLP